MVHSFLSRSTIDSAFVRFQVRNKEYEKKAKVKPNPPKLMTQYLTASTMVKWIEENKVNIHLNVHIILIISFLCAF